MSTQDLCLPLPFQFLSWVCLGAKLSRVPLWLKYSLTWINSVMPETSFRKQLTIPRPGMIAHTVQLVLGTVPGFISYDPHWIFHHSWKSLCENRLVFWCLVSESQWKNWRLSEQPADVLVSPLIRSMTSRKWRKGRLPQKMYWRTLTIFVLPTASQTSDVILARTLGSSKISAAQFPTCIWPDDVSTSMWFHIFRF